MRIHYFDNFRAVAILIVILGHCYVNWNIDTFPEQLVKNVITGGTSAFVFISGFFLHQIFYLKVTSLNFFNSKILKLAVPYTFLSLSYLIIFYFLTGSFPVHDIIEERNDFEIFVINFLTGHHIAAYWYIPFILIVFALTPLFFFFIKISFVSKLIIIVLGFGLSSFLWRPAGGLNPFHSFLYFYPFYLLGIAYSQYKEYFENIFVRYKHLILCAFIATVVSMTFLGQVGNSMKSIAFEIVGYDFMVLQKALLIMVFLAYLRAYANREIPIGKYIADRSFPLFFLHGWVIGLLSFSGINYLFSETFLGVILRFLLVVLLTLGSVNIIQKLLKSKSQYYIGS